MSSTHAKSDKKTSSVYCKKVIERTEVLNLVQQCFSESLADV